eukprot:7814854-Pyramimonas_sp.AAC.2
MFPSPSTCARPSSTLLCSSSAWSCAPAAWYSAATSARSGSRSTRSDADKKRLMRAACKRAAIPQPSYPCLTVLLSDGAVKQKTFRTAGGERLRWGGRAQQGGGGRGTRTCCKRHEGTYASAHTTQHCVPSATDVIVTVGARGHLRTRIHTSAHMRRHTGTDKGAGYRNKVVLYVPAPLKYYFARRNNIPH